MTRAKACALLLSLSASSGSGRRCGLLQKCTTSVKSVRSSTVYATDCFACAAKLCIDQLLQTSETHMILISEGLIQAES